MTSFKQELVSSLKDKPPSEPQNGVQNSVVKTGALTKGLLSGTDEVRCGIG